MFKFDADLTNVESGVWINWSGSRFLIAHTSNMKFQRALARNQQPHRRKIENGTIDPAVNKDILCKAMAEGMLLDWADVVNAQGVPTPYSTQAAFTALSKSVEFRDFVSDAAMNLMNFKNDEVEEMGNASSIG